MPRCPHCDFETQVISAFCPACGGAMQTPDVAQDQQQTKAVQEQAAPYAAPAARSMFRRDSLGMGWLRFLALFLLPLNIINGILSLLDLPETIAQFRSPQIAAFLTQPEKILFYASVVLAVVQVPLLCYALWGLFRQRWKGVQALLINYVINALYAITMTIVLLTLSGSDVAGLNSTITTFAVSMAGSAVAMIAMFFINRVYFNKRRGFFLPEKQ